jgi:hypothetical protein
MMKCNTIGFLKHPVLPNPDCAALTKIMDGFGVARMVFPW